jgi:hypothetical protein
MNSIFLHSSYGEGAAQLQELLQMGGVRVVIRLAT